MKIGREAEVVVVTMRRGPGAVLLTMMLLAACGSDGDDPSATMSSLDETAPVETEATVTEAAPASPTETEVAPTEPPETAAATTEPAAQVPYDVTTTPDVAYTASQTVDVYAPATGRDWPVVVYFHGGGGSPEDAVVVATAEGVAAQGAVVFVPEWASLGPDGGSQDTVCALSFAQRAAADYGGDGTRVTVSGYSTGGFTAAVHALMADQAPLGLGDCLDDALPALPAAAVPGGTPFFVVEAARAGMFAANPQWNQLTAEQLTAFDPYALLGSNPIIDMVLVVGRRDVGGGQLGEIPIAESNREYHAALLAAGYDATLVELPGGHELEPGTPKFERWVRSIVSTAART